MTERAEFTTRQTAPRKRDEKKRPRLTERKVIEVLLNQGAIIPCGICRLAFVPRDVGFIERDHRLCEHEVPDEDLDTVWAALGMQQYVHGRQDPNNRCHADKTAQGRKIKAKHDRIKGITGNGWRREIKSRGFPSKEERLKAKQMRQEYEARRS